MKQRIKSAWRRITNGSGHLSSTFSITFTDLLSTNNRTIIVVLFVLCKRYASGHLTSDEILSNHLFLRLETARKIERHVHPLYRGIRYERARWRITRIDDLRAISSVPPHGQIKLSNDDDTVPIRTQVQLLFPRRKCTSTLAATDKPTKFCGSRFWMEKFAVPLPVHVCVRSWFAGGIFSTENSSCNRADTMPFF